MPYIRLHTVSQKLFFAYDSDVWRHYYNVMITAKSGTWVAGATHCYFTRLNPKRMGPKLMGLLHTSGYLEQPSGYKNCTRNCIRNKTFLFVSIETYNFHNLYDLGFCETSQNSILSNKILYLNVTRIALFHSNLIAMKLCNSFNFF